MLLFDPIFDIGFPGYVLVASAVVCILFNRRSITTKPVFWIPLLVGFSISGFLRYLSFHQLRSSGVDMDVVALATVAKADLIVSFSAILAILTFVCSKPQKKITEQGGTSNGG